MATICQGPIVLRRNASTLRSKKVISGAKTVSATTPIDDEGTSDFPILELNRHRVLGSSKAIDC